MGKNARASLTVTTTATDREASITAQSNVAYVMPRLNGAGYTVKPQPPAER